MAETVRRKKLYKNTNFYKPNSKMVDRRHIYILPYPTDTEFYTLVKKISSPMEKSSQVQTPV